MDSFSEQLCQSQKDFIEFRSLALKNVDYKIANKCERNVWKFTTLYSHKHDENELNGTMVTLNIRRGPKLEGCAFANFGNSSGARRNRTSGV